MGEWAGHPKNLAFIKGSREIKKGVVEKAPKGFLKFFWGRAFFSKVFSGIFGDPVFKKFFVRIFCGFFQAFFGAPFGGPKEKGFWEK